MHKQAFSVFSILLTQPQRLIPVEKTASTLQPFQERISNLSTKLGALLKVPKASTAAKYLGAAALAPAVYQGLQEGSEQRARMRDLIATRQQQLDAPTIPLKVKSAEKLAFTPYNQRGLYPSSVSSGQSAVANAFAKSLVERPLNALGEMFNKKVYSQPKQNKAFEHASKNDEYIAKALKENPDQVHDAYKTMRRFGPSLAEDPNAVRSFLRQTTMAGGNIDYATLRMLAETEKFIRQSRNPGSSP